MQNNWNASSVALSNTTASSATAVDSTPLWLRLWFELIEPWILLFGMLTNLLVVAVMPRQSVAVAPSAKFYYVSIAAVDVFNLINSWVIYTFLGDTLFLLSGDTYKLRIVTANDVVCAANLMGWEVAETYSNYAVVAMMLERCVVVLFPLRAKSVLGLRFTLMLTAACVVPPWAALVVPSAFVLGVQHDPSWSVLGTWCGWYTDRPLYIYFAWAFQLVMFTIHEIGSTLLMVVLSAAIVASGRRRRRLLHSSTSDGSDSGGSSSSSSKERGAIVTMTTVALINVLVYVPTFITTTMNNVIDTSGWSSDAVNLLGNLGRFFEDAVCIAHAVNFLVYFCRIPTFRAELSNFFSFCLSK